MQVPPLICTNTHQPLTDRHIPGFPFAEFKFHQFIGAERKSPLKNMQNNPQVRTVISRLGQPLKHSSRSTTTSACTMSCSSMSVACIMSAVWLCPARSFSSDARRVSSPTFLKSTYLIFLRCHLLSREAVHRNFPPNRRSLRFISAERCWHTPLTFARSVP